jgi:hypothetical protein
MRKLVLAAALLGTSMPAPAALVYEIEGVYSGYRIDQWTRTTKPLGTYYYKLNGILSCSWDDPKGYVNANGFGDECFSYHSYYFEFDFLFKGRPIFNPISDDWKLGWGEGLYQHGYVVYDSYYLKMSRGRIWEDGKTYDPWEYGFQIRQGAPVPEPATWAMMIGGFALVGASMRRKTTIAFA